jgi:hypothetical protein
MFLDFKEANPDFSSKFFLVAPENLPGHTIEGLAEVKGVINKPVKLFEFYELLKSVIPSVQAFEDDDLDVMLKNLSKLPGTVKNELFESFMGGVYNKWKRLLKQQSIDMVESFANEVMKIGKEKKNASINKYASEILSAVHSFDIENILMLLQQFQQIIECLKEGKKLPE